MVQVLVPISATEAADDDERQYYTYINESDYPGANRFNVGDKVQINHADLFSEKYSHTVELVNWDLSTKQWIYYVGFDLSFSSSNPKVQAWLEDISDDPRYRGGWFSQEWLSEAYNTTVHLYGTAA